MKKIFFFILIFFCFNTKIFSINLPELIESTIFNNIEIRTALNNYESILISKRTFDGVFSPSITTGFSESITKNDSEIKNISSFLSYSQPLPGGLIVSTIGNFAIISQKNINDNYLYQTPSVKFTITQSLFPFWLQGIKNDPQIENFNLQSECSYYQYINTKKTILINLVQNYINALIYKNEIETHKNSIEIVNKQISVLNDMKDIGASNLSKIIELENLRWTYQQNLLSSEIDLNSCIKNLKTISCINFDEELIDISLENDFIEIIHKILDYINDPVELLYQKTLEIIKVKRIYEKQTSAPYLNVSLSPTWSLNGVKKRHLLDVLLTMEKPSNWELSLSVDFSPLLLNGIRKNSERYTLSYEKTLDEYNSYISHKEFAKREYMSLLDFYGIQRRELSSLIHRASIELEDYKKIFEEGSISEIEFLSIETRLKNQKVTKNIIDLNILLYKFLFNMQ